MIQARLISQATTFDSLIRKIHMLCGGDRKETFTSTSFSRSLYLHSILFSAQFVLIIRLGKSQTQATCVHCTIFFSRSRNFFSRIFTRWGKDNRDYDQIIFNFKPELKWLSIDFMKNYFKSGDKVERYFLEF